MTRREFTSRTESLSRKHSLFTLLTLTSLLAGMIIAAFIERHYPDRANSALGGLSLLPFFVCCGWIVWCGLRLPGKLGLLCPHCRKPLTEANRRTALLTGKCGRCGKEVFSEMVDERRAGNAPRLNRQKFASSITAQTRETNRRLIGWLLAGLLAAIGGVPLMKRLNDLIDQGRFDHMNTALITWIAAVPVGAVFLLLIFMFFCSATGRLKQEGIPCPECRKRLCGPPAQVAIATSACVYCGEKILDGDLAPKA